jgi:hypothetical protein
MSARNFSPLLSTSCGRSQHGIVFSPTALHRAAICSTLMPAGKLSISPVFARHSTRDSAPNSARATVDLPLPLGPCTRPICHGRSSSGRVMSHSRRCFSSGGASNMPQTCRPRVVIGVCDSTTT